MKKYIFIIIVFIAVKGIAQQENGAQQFWNSIKNNCGKAFEGEIISAPEDSKFRNKKLIIHVKSCSENIIKIPFIVGKDRSRTFILTYKNNRIQLKHDHRHEDGLPDEVTMYGGTTSNTGLPNIQFFPADQETSDLISYASTNVWWITVDKTSFTYNLRRVENDKPFTVKFDLTKSINLPEAQWGWED